MRAIIFIIILILMGLIEGAWKARPWHDSRSKRWVFHFSLSVFNTLFTRLLVVGPLYLWLNFVLEKQWGLAQVLGLNGPLEIVLTIIVLDFFDYWWHLWNHSVPFLWRFHKAHHSDTHVDVTTALRFHPGELILSCLMKSIWILVWGPSVMGFILFEACITAYAQFHHSNIDFSDRWESLLRWVHMTPRLHASHHTVTTRTRNANYSTIFLLWDRLFGTFQEVDRQELKKLGLPEGRDHDLDFILFMKMPFKGLFKTKTKGIQ